MIRLEISGKVTDRDTGRPLPGLYVKAHDKDLLFDDLLGSSFSNDEGTFRIITSPSDYRDFFEVKPDVYVNVHGPDGDFLLLSTKENIRWNVNRDQYFDIQIPHDQLVDIGYEVQATLMGDDGRPRETFEAGEPLIIGVDNVRPSALHTLTVTDSEGNELFTQTLMSDQHGTIPSSIIWPLLGFDDPQSNTVFSYEEAQARWRGQRMGLQLRDGEHTILETGFSLPEIFIRPLALSTDSSGRMSNGFVAGEQAATVALHNVPWEGATRVYMVERHHDWREGDAFTPVTLANGRPAFVDVEIAVASGSLLTEIAAAEELQPGAYDFIVRQLRYGYEDDEDFSIRASDIIGHRQMTGLVVREEFMASKFAYGGCVNLQHISGRRISGRPYFQYTNVFQKDEDVWAALDPNALEPNHESKMVALYVIEHKDSSQWSSDNSLQHLSQLGGNTNVLKFKTQTGCINYNKQLVWPSASNIGEYDIIADFGNDTADASAFNPDQAFNQPTDIIDGYVMAGFRVIEDPSIDVDERFNDVGIFEYNDGPITVTDDSGTYDPYVPGSTQGTVSRTLDAKARVYFPADVANANNATEISAVESSYPIFAIVHGNSSVSNSYQGYNYLMEHAASNGFICVSVHSESGMRGRGRAEVLFHHLDRIKAMFGSKADDNIGIMGHSRGGEAVAMAARMAQQQGLPHNINAVISLAPTDQYGRETLGSSWATPLMVVYGSLDGDVAGWPEPSGVPLQTGFSIYDRADDANKSMHFIYGACHNRFNTTWGTEGGAMSEGASRLLSPDAHEACAKGYMLAFLRYHLLNQAEFEGVMNGTWVPTAVQTADSGKARVYTQYHAIGSNRLDVDTFEGTHTPISWETSTIGGTVDHNSTLPADPQENTLIQLDTRSPHDTAGCMLHWDGTGDRLSFDLNGMQNVTGYNAISIRISQKVGSSHNPAGIQDLYMTLRDQDGNHRDIRVSKFVEIPEPHERLLLSSLTKSAMNSVRIPLHAFTIKVAGALDVNLEKVTEASLWFGVKPTGEIEIDSLAFTH